MKAQGTRMFTSGPSSLTLYLPVPGQAKLNRKNRQSVFLQQSSMMSRYCRSFFCKFHVSEVFLCSLVCDSISNRHISVNINATSHDIRVI